LDKAAGRAAIIALASFVARARSPVARDYQGEITLVLDPEAPTRITKMLAQLWRACGRLGLGVSDAWALVHRIGLDSIPKLRRAVLDYLATCDSVPATTTTIAEAIRHPSRTTRRALEDLAAHHLVERIAGGQGKSDRWVLAGLAQNWLAQMTVPVSAGPVYPPDGDGHEPDPLLKTPNTKEEIAGKPSGAENTQPVTGETRDSSRSDSRAGARDENDVPPTVDPSPEPSGTDPSDITWRDPEEVGLTDTDDGPLANVSQLSGPSPSRSVIVNGAMDGAIEGAQENVAAQVVPALTAAGLPPVEAVTVEELADPVPRPYVDGWRGRLPAPGEPPMGISHEAWARRSRGGRGSP
jgi:hypothetical protein